MSRRKIVLAGVLAGGAVLVVIPVWVLPAILVHWAEKTVAESCEGCRLTVGRAHLWFFPPSFAVDSAKLVAGQGTSTEVRVDSGEVRGRLALFSLLRRRFTVESASVEAPTVVLVERPRKKNESENESRSEAGDGPRWRWSVGRVEVTDGKFRFERHALGKIARIAFDRVRAESEPFRVEDGGVTTLAAHATARLEGTGAVKVDVAIPSLAKPLKIEVDVAVAGQPLDRVNRYLFPDAGVRLAGTLVDGRSHVSVADRELRSSLDARYEGLKVDVDPNVKRSPLVASVMDFVAKIKFREKNTDKPRAERKDEARLERENGEPIVAFILRGMKEAAFAVASR